MAETQSRSRFVRFGAFEANVQTGELRKDGVKLKFSGQPFQVLAILLERPGEVVTREELQKRLWPDTFVDVERNLNTAVNKIREVLGDSAETPRFVETLPRRGYRFIGAVSQPPTIRMDGTGAEGDVQVSKAMATVPEVAPADLTRSLKSRPLFWVLVGLGGAVAALLTGAVFLLRRPLPRPRISEYVRLTLDGRHKRPIGADASRLYVSFEDSPIGTGVVPLSGGEIAKIPLEIPNLGQCTDCVPVFPFSGVSPDGSRLLIMGREYPDGQEIWNVDSSGHSARFLTKGIAVCWSPDGKQVLYSNVNGDLLVISSEGGEPKMILPSAARPGQTSNIGSLSWSPDGTRIRFRSDTFRFWEISSSGTNLHRVLPGWDDSTAVCCGHWTPDGDFFVYLATKAIVRATDRSPAGQLWALDERKGRIGRHIAEPIRLTDGPNLWGLTAISTDGKKIFSQQTTLRGELVSYDAGSKQFQPYLKGISAEFVAFSRDGKYVAYVSFPDGVLWRANPDGSGSVQLTRPPFYPKLPRWSPDGTQIVFEDERQTAEYAIYAVSSQGGSPVRLVPEDPRPQLDPTWSPDGKQIAYCTDPRSSPKGDSITKVETHILNIASHTITTLPISPHGFVSPRWSPDGRLLMGITLSPSTLEVFDLQTKQYRTLLGPVPVGFGFNQWSHDGRYVYFWSEMLGSSAILRIPITGGKPELVADLSAFRFTGFFNLWFALDPQDAPLLLLDRGTQEIYALTLDRK
jgi:Tol biopolymer transport system component/DNA-binding winged helix-turn-helix (wHTH) protein